MKTITSDELKALIKARYPNATDVQIDDGVYDVLTKKQCLKIYNGFQSSMWKINLIQWIRNKLDCDKWAKLLIAHVIIRNALGSGSNAKAIGLLRYWENAHPSGSHVINVCVLAIDGTFELQELEPQPKGGFTELTNHERNTAWSLDF